MLLALLLIFVTVPVSAVSADLTVYDYHDSEGWPEAPEVTAKSVYMIEVNSGAVLMDKEGTAQSFPASTTKIMTCLLTLENCSLDEEVTFSHDAIYDIEDGGHNYEFQEGEVLTVDECLQFLMVASVNEVAYALAEHVAGSVSAFADMMNERAKQLGAENTHFCNANGLNDENHYTTARDMALILWGCIQNEQFQHYASLQSVSSLKGRAIKTDGFSTYNNHHLMLLPGDENYDEDVVCGKTGFTSLAGNTLVTYARRDDMDVVCIIMQGGSDRFVDTKKMLDYAFDQFQLLSAAEAGAEPEKAPGENLSLLQDGREGKFLLVPKEADLSKVTSGFSLQTAAAEDQVTGERNWFYEGLPMGKEQIIWEKQAPETESASEPATSDAPAKKRPAASYAGWTLQELIAFCILGILLIVLIILLVFLIRSSLRQRKKRRRRARYRKQEADEEKRERKSRKR